MSESVGVNARECSARNALVNGLGREYSVVLV